MTTLDKAIELFGFENPITITIAVLAEQGENELAEQLFEECSKDIYGDPQDAEGSWDEDMGFDPYMGCYTGDC